MTTLLIATTIVLTLSNGSTTQVANCSSADARAAEEGVDRLRTWADLHRAFARFAACDDGAIAEGWSDFVARTLATRWNRTTDLQRLVAKDEAFRNFVIGISTRPQRLKILSKPTPTRLESVPEERNFCARKSHGPYRTCASRLESFRTPLEMPQSV